jgi:hypothetical protein
MTKELPSNIQSLTDEIEKASEQERYHKRMAEEEGDRWLKLRIERQRQCNHRYADGTSAWRHNYAYSSCDICGESDL